MTMTSKEFCDMLRVNAASLANGDVSELQIKELDLQCNIAPEDLRKINASYIRTIMNRTPEVKAVGAVKVERVRGDADIPDCYRVTINKNPKRRLLTDEELPKLESKWRAKFIAQLLKTQPRISDLEGDRLEGAAIALERMNEMLNEMVKMEDE